MDPESIVRDFCNAFARQDLAELLGYFAEDAVYHNIPLPPAEGLAAIEATLKQFLDPSGEAKFEIITPLMRRFGHLVSAGFYGTEDLVALQPLRNGELSVDLVSGWTTERMDNTRALIAAGHLQTLPLITHHFPARRAADAWGLIQTRDEPVLGVVLDW